MDFRRLFLNCAFDINYQECGDHVNYAFKSDGRTLYIYFEGSDGDVDWRRNFSYWRKPYKDMEIEYRVHGGFLKCWKEVEDIIIAKITETKSVVDLSYKWDRIIVVGYSHGGALAAFAHECVWFHRPDIREQCWTVAFEGPRVYAGLKVKAELVERWKNFRLIRNRADLVTHVPPRAFGFCHVGEIVQIGGKWKPCAALKKSVKALFKKDWQSLKEGLKEIVCIWPHYQSEMVESLTDFDRSDAGILLRKKIGID